MLLISNIIFIWTIDDVIAVSSEDGDEGDSYQDDEIQYTEEENKYYTENFEG